MDKELEQKASSGVVLIVCSCCQYVWLCSRPFSPHAQGVSWFLMDLKLFEEMDALLFETLQLLIVKSEGGILCSFENN